jgi:hypothetical protein
VVDVARARACSVWGLKHCLSLVCVVGSSEGLTLLEAEHTLALLNEYLVQVAAPGPMPAGFQVRIMPLNSHDPTGVFRAGDALPPLLAQTHVVIIMLCQAGTAPPLL